MDDMTLYQINKQLARLLELPGADGKVDEETGEFFDSEALAALDMAKEKKIEDTLLWCKNRKAFIKALRDEAQSLLDRAESLQKKVERAESYVQITLDNQDFETKKVKTTFKTTTSCPKEINLATLPREYIRIIPEKVTPASEAADKTKLLKALRALKKAGQEAKIGDVVLEENVKMNYE